MAREPVTMWGAYDTELERFLKWTCIGGRWTWDYSDHPFGSVDDVLQQRDFLFERLNNRGSAFQFYETLVLIPTRSDDLGCVQLFWEGMETKDEFMNCER